MIELTPVPASRFDRLMEMSWQIWPSTYGPIIGDAQVEYMINRFYAPEKLRADQEAGHHIFFITSDGREIGFTHIETRSDDHFIHKIYLLPQCQGRGAGQKSLDLIKEKFSVKPIRLQVNRQNIKAINFYFRNGFVIEQTADFDIGDGYFMNDFVMVGR